MEVDNQDEALNEFMIQNTRWRVPRNYINLKPLGTGGYGSVCSAFDNHLGEEIVIKKLSKTFESREHARRTFREIKLLKHVSHDNIMQLRNIFCNTRTIAELNDVYLVSTYMDSTLFDRIYKDQRPISDDYKKIYSYQLIRGLKYLHACNIIHRDIKPTNITIHDRELRIIDFGLAREENVKMTGYVMTRWYRAPEIMIHWQRYSKAIDVWSCGCVIAEMFIKKPLFKAQNANEHLNLIISKVGYPSKEHLAEWDDYARSYVEKCTNIEVAKCFADNFPEIDRNSETGAKVIDLLNQMLKLNPNPNERIELEKALRHPYLVPYYNIEEDEQPINHIFNDPHENNDYPVDKWKEIVFKEIISFHELNNRNNNNLNILNDEHHVPQ